MSDKNLVIAVLACFAVAIAFFLVIVWEINKSIKFDRKVRTEQAQQKQITIDDNRDFSIYETLVGDDGREMVLVPEGVFSRGSLEGDFDEKPPQEVYLDAFYVDKYEVSVEAYNKFRKAANYVESSVPFFEGEHELLKHPNVPQVGVSWYDAVNYCTWAGKRLLTEAEWEKAARGTHGLVYPWGNEMLPRRANIHGTADGYQYLAPIGSFPMGRSVYGIYDMAGNVSEWVEDWYDQFYYQEAPMMNPTGAENKKNRVFRGGSWDSTKVDVRASKRYAATPGRKDSVVGFRCGKSVEK
ncbi:formylglycine-generating enzyme family protein [Nitrospina sp. 32_T5]|uniref:formylglycine-generating enzyme family protein n=1 Tax=unclassified Nitrospina TaxID=2638683 RepID=UPI003F9A9925